MAAESYREFLRLGSGVSDPPWFLSIVSGSSGPTATRHTVEVSSQGKVLTKPTHLNCESAWPRDSVCGTLNFNMSLDTPLPEDLWPHRTYGDE